MDTETFLVKAEGVQNKLETPPSHPIDFSFPAISKRIDTLICDRTTGKNIIWATDNYQHLGYASTDCIDPNSVLDGIVVSRIDKSSENAWIRQKERAEVFTPSWVCNFMNNVCDNEWFGRENVFNAENSDETWTVNINKIVFPTEKSWKDYVDVRFLEITCGECPFIASRYDASSGEPIGIPDRIGILDRKLRIVCENTQSQDEWIAYALRAIQSCYGYEWSGDSLLIARANILMTFIEHFHEQWKSIPIDDILDTVANIVSHNFWQMNGLTGTIPYGVIKEYRQMTLFDESPLGEEQKITPACKIMNWHTGETIKFSKLSKGGKMKKMFDFVIGNPPYQEINDKNGRQPPVYHMMMDAAYDVSDVAVLITPARFLFDVGQTPKEWNMKMLNDEHLKVLKYEPLSSNVFPGTDIKGGVTITYHNCNKKFEKIGVFIPYRELKKIHSKVTKTGNPSSLDSLVSSQGIYRFTELFFRKCPHVTDLTGAGTGNKIVSTIVDELPEFFLTNKPEEDGEYATIWAKNKTERTVTYIRKDYINVPHSFFTYKVIVPESNGSGAIGEVLSTPLIGQPLIGHTDTFLSIGSFDTEYEAEACLKYVKSKFARAMLGIKKVTQHNGKDTWQYVPLQDFTPDSDIDWSQSISDIDKQLYAKYGLSAEEIEFIETKVKRMD